MARATSPLHRSFSGAIGDLIFRNYNGKTIVSIRPVYKNETNTEARKKARDRFREAVNYARYAIRIPKLKAYYAQKARQLKLPNPYTAAITDFLRKAKANATTNTTFAGKKGEVVKISVTKTVFKIDKITAMLCDKDGEVLSEQNLTKPATSNIFTFKCTADFPDYAFLKIITDEPGKTSYIIEAKEFLRAVLK